MIGLLAAVLLAASIGPPHEAAGIAPAGPSDPEGAPGAMRTEEPQARQTRDLDGTRQEMALGLHSMTFWSRESSHYTFHSLALTYLRSKGNWGPFLHLSAFLPLQARQDGRVYYAGDVYGKRIGGDFLLGWQGRWYPWESTEAEVGPGLHASFLWLPGETGYTDFTAMPLGIGAQGIMRWRTGQRIGSSYLRLGAFAAANGDVVDFLRSNDLRIGFTFLAGLAMGLDD